MELQEILENAEQMKKHYEEVQNSTPYAKTRDKIDTLKNKIFRMEQQIKALEVKKEKQSKRHYAVLDKLPYGYMDTKLTPIAEELLRRNPNLKSFYVIGAFGINAEASIWFYEDELGYTSDLNRIVATLTFHSDMTVHTGEYSNKYPVGSIGDLNGENKIMVKVESIDQLNDLMHKSYDKHKAGKEETHV